MRTKFWYRNMANTPQRQAPLPFNAGISPLENGDRLTHQKLERRYNAMPQLKKAELIEGIVYRTAAFISQDEYVEGAHEFASTVERPEELLDEHTSANR